MLSVGRGGISTINIGVEDLSDYERLQRMGDDSQYEVALVKGIMAFQSQAYSHAEKYFGMTHPLLKKQLLMKLRGEGSEQNVHEQPVRNPAPDRNHKEKEKRVRHPRNNRFDIFDKDDDEDDIFGLE